MKKLGILISLGLLVLTGTGLYAKYEQEQMQMESQLQQRVEGILSKTLPANSYLVTVKVEMENRERPTTQQSSSAKRGRNNLLGQNQYVLPGVPQKKEFVPPQETSTESTLNTFSAETLVKRILITILVAPDITADQIRGVREVINSSIPFNPLRGDEMDIRNSPLLKPITTSGGPAQPLSNGVGNQSSGGESFLGSLSSRANAPVLVIMGALLMAFVLLIAFLFGPVRAFLNRLLAVLPRIGEQAAYTVSNAPAKAAPGTTANPLFNNGGNGSGGHAADEGPRPFRFLRADQLPKLPILFKNMSAQQCAIVLAYLPAEWASQVLGSLEPGAQTAIMGELSQAREVPPDIVKGIEEQIKLKIPYMVGGVEWIQSVYQLTQPQTQRALLGTLNQQSPELAQTLRRKTFFLEDLNVISAGGLRLLCQEVGYPMVALAIRDDKPENREALLKRLPVAMREILQQELELSSDDKNAATEAKTKMLDVGRRLLTEGRLTLPEVRNR